CRAVSAMFSSRCRQDLEGAGSAASSSVTAASLGFGGTAKGVSSFSGPCLRYCHSTIRLVTNATRYPSPARKHIICVPLNWYVGWPEESTVFSEPEKATRVLNKVTTLIIGPASK